MTVSTTATSVTVAGNGATTTFAYNFPIPDATTAFLQLSVAGVVTATYNSTQFGITGIGTPGGTFTFPLSGSPVLAGTSITLLRQTPILQSTVLATQGGFYPAVIEASLDKLTLIAQEITNSNRGMIGPAGPAGPPYTGGVLAGDISQTGAQSLTYTAVGQGRPDYSSFHLFTTTSHSTADELAASFEIVSNVGHAASVPLSWNKVAGFFGIHAQGASGNVWAINPIVIVDPGACIIGGVQCSELDSGNNSGVHFGDATDSTGSIQPAFIGQQITGVGTNRATAADYILGVTTGGGPMWNNGRIYGTNSIVQRANWDLSNCRVSYDVWGSHVYGFDTSNAAFTGLSYRMGAQQKMGSRNQANTADLTLLQTSGGDDLLIGGAGVASVQVLSSFKHASTTLGFFGAVPTTIPTITGAKGGNTALASLITRLAALGLCLDSTT